MTILAADRIVIRDSVNSRGWLRIDGEAIAEVGDGEPPSPADVDLRGLTVVPGFVDMHCHGGGGADFVGDGAIAGAFHLRNGTTTMLASIVTAPLDLLVEQLDHLHDLVESGAVSGIHLEGPFLSSAQRGAHDPRLLRDPTPDLLDRIVDAARGSLRMVTLAPELPEGIDAIHRLRAHGVVVAIGHTDATYAQTVAAIEAGASVATHLFNGMRSLHHREPGPALALLEAPGVVCELICDGVHVHPSLARAVLRTQPDRVALISDAISATGMGDGTFMLGGREVTVEDGTSRLEGGLAGSTTTLGRAVQIAVTELGLPLVEAVRMATATPAAALGLDKVGALEVGRRADLAVLDERLEVVSVMRAGRWVVSP